MTKLRFIWVGKTRSPYIKEGLRDYADRIDRWVPLSIVEIQDRGDSALGGAVRGLEREEREIRRKIPKRSKIVTFDPRGVELDSAAFAGMMEKWIDSSAPSVSFVLGGPDGLSEGIVSSADKNVSFSKMTFTHELSRLLVMEQIYRALSIIRNHPFPR